MLWFALFLLWLLAELFVMIEVAREIGVLLMLLALVISWPIGTRLLRSQGRSALRRLSQAAAQGRTPTAEVVDGALVLAGSALLIIPGFIDDVVGLLLMIPPLRRVAGKRLTRHLTNGPLRRIIHFGAGGSSYDAESTATDIDSPQLPG